jgi:hypothetical protein
MIHLHGSGEGVKKLKAKLREAGLPSEVLGQLGGADLNVRCIDAHAIQILALAKHVGVTVKKTWPNGLPQKLTFHGA